MKFDDKGMAYIARIIVSRFEGEVSEVGVGKKQQVATSHKKDSHAD